MIRKQVQEAVQDTLQNEVFEVIRDVVLGKVQSDVYDVYDPRRYRRRSDNSPDGGGQGLGDKNNIIFQLEGRETNQRSKTLVVWNIAKFNPWNNPHQAFSTAKRKDNILQRLIIDGWSRTTDDSPAWMQPRPFIASAQRAIDRGGEYRSSLEEAFETGLARHGIHKIK